MVKRRNSPYASHDRSLKKAPNADFTPCIIDPPPSKPNGHPLQEKLSTRFGMKQL